MHIKIWNPVRARVWIVWDVGAETALAYDDLRDWIKTLDKAGELKHIHEPVDPILEIAEITDRVSKWGETKGLGRRCCLRT